MAINRNPSWRTVASRPASDYRPTLIYAEPCDAVGEAGKWVTLAASTVTLDTDNVLTGRAATGSVKVTCTTASATSTARVVLAAPVSIAASHLRVRYRLLAGEGASSPATVNAIKLYFLTDGNNYAYVTLYTKSATLGTDGWHEVAFERERVNEGATGTLNWESVGFIQLRVEKASATDTPAVVLDAIQFYAPPSGAWYSFTFDDGINSQFDMAAYLASYGISGTFYVIPGRVATGIGDHMSLARLRALRDMGHIVANHTYSHKVTTWSTDLTDAQMAAEITQASDWLTDNGFGDGARMLAIPGGRWKPTDRTLYGRLLDNVRTSTAAPSTAVQTLLRPWMWRANSSDSVANAATIMARAIAYDGGSISLWHGAGGGGQATLADFKTHVDAVVAARNGGDIRIVSMADLPGIG